MSNFEKHPSNELVTLFNKKPYQGSSPEKSKIIFLSSDANYSHEITQHQFFKYILEYQDNGVAFWNKYDCHHPFLLNCYPFNRSKAGVPFHRNFSKLGLGSEFADQISFIELLDVPTIGNKSNNKKRFFELVSLKHLEYLDALIMNGGNKLFFVSKGVLIDMVELKKKFNVFDWLNIDQVKAGSYSVEINGNYVREVFHFSSSQIHGQIEEISSVVRSWLGKC